jgi:hypothetical protein
MHTRIRDGLGNGARKSADSWPQQYIVVAHWGLRWLSRGDSGSVGVVVAQ